MIDINSVNGDLMRELGLKLLRHVALQQTIVVAFFFIVTLQLLGISMLASVLLNVVVAFVTLRKGVYAGAYLLALPAAGTFLLYLSGGLHLQFLVSGVSLFVIYGLASVLHVRRSWEDVLKALSIVGISLIIIAYMVNPLLRQQWLDMMNSLIMLMPKDQPLPAELSGQIEVLSQYVVGGQVMFGLLEVSLLLMVARQWQSRLFMSGGFASEFCKLRLGRWFSGVLLLPLLLTLGEYTSFLPSEWTFISTDFWVVLLVPLLLAGFALMHAYVGYRQWGRKGVVLGYGLFFLLLPSGISLYTLCAFTMLDSVMDFRQRHNWDGGG